MRVQVLLLVLGACGRLDFDARLDGAAGSGTGSDAATGSAISVVQTASSATGAADTTIAVALSPTQAGTTIIVATTNWKPGAMTSGVADDAGDTFVSANALSLWSVGNPDHSVAEIWFAASGHGGATTVIVTGQAANRELWVLEAAGLTAGSRLDVVNTTSEGAASLQPTSPPLTPTQVPALIVAVGTFTDVFQVHPPSRFTLLTPLHGNAGAYTVADTAGTYAAIWDQMTLSGFCASAAAFR